MNDNSPKKKMNRTSPQKTITQTQMYDENDIMVAQVIKIENSTNDCFDKLQLNCASSGSEEDPIKRHAHSQQKNRSQRSQLHDFDNMSQKERSFNIDGLSGQDGYVGNHNPRKTQDTTNIEAKNNADIQGKDAIPLKKSNISSGKQTPNAEQFKTIFSNMIDLLKDANLSDKAKHNILKQGSLLEFLDSTQNHPLQKSSESNQPQNYKTYKTNEGIPEHQNSDFDNKEKESSHPATKAKGLAQIVEVLQEEANTHQSGFNPHEQEVYLNMKQEVNFKVEEYQKLTDHALYMPIRNDAGQLIFTEASKQRARWLIRGYLHISVSFNDKKELRNDADDIIELFWCQIATFKLIYGSKHHLVIGSRKEAVADRIVALAAQLKENEKKEVHKSIFQPWPYIFIWCIEYFQAETNFIWLKEVKKTTNEQKPTELDRKKKQLVILRKSIKIAVDKINTLQPTTQISSLVKNFKATGDIQTAVVHSQNFYRGLHEGDQKFDLIGCILIELMIQYSHNIEIAAAGMLKDDFKKSYRFCPCATIYCRGWSRYHRQEKNSCFGLFQYSRACAMIIVIFVVLCFFSVNAAVGIGISDSIMAGQFRFDAMITTKETISLGKDATFAGKDATFAGKDTISSGKDATPSGKDTTEMKNKCDSKHSEVCSESMDEASKVTRAYFNNLHDSRRTTKHQYSDRFYYQNDLY